MSESEKTKYLSLALRVFAAVFVLGVYPLTVFWPSGWCWSSGPPEYLHMIVGLYATLGVFLWLASQAPEAHVGLVSFTIWSSIVHATIMAVQSFHVPASLGHLLGDVPALYLVAGVLGWLSPRAFRLKLRENAA